MKPLQEIKLLVRHGLYYLTEHAYAEASSDGFDIHDIERGLLTGRRRRVWEIEDKIEVVGTALDGRPIGMVCRVTQSGKVRVITVYRDRPKGSG